MLSRASRGALKKAEHHYLTRETKGDPAVFGICNAKGEVIRKRVIGGDLVRADVDPTLFIPEKLEKLLSPKDVKVIYGGRGSSKTRTAASIINEGIRYHGHRVLCMREIQSSIAESSHAELSDDIERRGLSPGQMVVTDNRIKSKVSNGLAWFAGLLRNLASIKGKAGLNVGWCDEAENVSLMSWDVVTPTLRAEGSELYITFNPRFDTDPTWTEFVAPYLSRMVDGIYEDDEILVINCNWRDNPWFTSKLTRQKDAMKMRDLDRYNWIWEGLFNKKSDIQVLGGKWVVDDFEPGEDWSGPYFGADFGFSQDPATLIKTWIHDEVLYIEHEAYKQGVELDDYPKFYAGKEGATPNELLTWTPLDDEKWPGIPGAKKHLIQADESAPAIISKIASHGFKIRGAEKNFKDTGAKGSIETGIIFLRSFKKIVIHTRCRHTASEASLYWYKQDKLTEEILTDIIDAHNHAWDAVRYALVTLINRKKRGFFG